MTQEDGELDSLVRKRIRALRVAQGWSLEDLATRARLSHQRGEDAGAPGRLPGFGYQR